MPRLRFLAGPSLERLVPIEANSGVPLKVSSDIYEGELLVYIKGFEDTEGSIRRSSYFEQKERKNVTWSFQAQGRFLQPRSADDIMFGNVFERPYKLPWGFGAALRFMKYIDPTLEQDLASRTRPWALSPIVATMPHLVHSRTDDPERIPAFPPRKPIQDSMPYLSLPGQDSILGVLRGGDKSASQRKSYFASATRRKQVIFGPEDIITTDFCYEYLSFSSNGISLQLPGISIDIMRYWDGQPVQFVCCERGDSRSGGKPWGRVFWCVVVELAEPDEGVDSEKILDSDSGFGHQH
ncbi:hypothetical protein BXZ70DRAFT_900489 [Cristinia sonorae]|uniref:Domain of unknown function at the cortex 1 domain-containing protein n=1 Tax=Cristinia sonorae TaxID=1940300 RepID=A0A8K0UF55_9AGAR|nr:hypothetical protein BXZ70DRAFT_900489 [Cristinia sonorae]